MRNKAKGPRGKFYGMVKVGEKGQIVIPKEARDMFGIEPGDTLLLLADSKRGIAIPGKEKTEQILFDIERGISASRDETETGEEE